MAKSKSKKKVKVANKSASGRKQKSLGTSFGITVTSGTPRPDPAGVETEELILFTNKDTMPYMLQLFAEDGSPVLVGALLPATGQNGGTLYLAAESVAGSCTYNLLAWPSMQPASPADSGMHTITITSGGAGRAKSKAAGAAG
ncbi:MAG: hypothetical protein ABSG16_12295 [Candidatus Acidiferrum sp.]|jgi:hypothetical protein